MLEVLRLLHEINGSTTRYSASYYVRSLEPYEPIPQFGHGIAELPKSQKDWIWVAYSSKDDTPLAIIVACPMQGIALLLRAYGIPSAPKSIFVGLLRKSLADMLSRGYTQYATFLCLDRPEERKLARLIEKAEGKQANPGAHYLYHGPTDISKWGS